MKTKKIEILTRFAHRCTVGAICDVDVDEDGVPLNPLITQYIADGFIKWVDEPKITKKTSNRKKDVDIIGENTDE